MNPSSEQIEKVVDLIYDAAAENDLWRNVLTVIADLTNSQGGILFGVSFDTRAIYYEFNGRLDEECNRAYQERHMQNPYADLHGASAGRTSARAHQRNPQNDLDDPSDHWAAAASGTALASC